MASDPVHPVARRPMPSPTLATCPRCRGFGDVIGPDGYSATCPRCDGDGRVNAPTPQPTQPEE